jgi:D-alanyl-D-alanine carboxypeptidase
MFIAASTDAESSIAPRDRFGWCHARIGGDETASATEIAAWRLREDFGADAVTDTCIFACSNAGAVGTDQDRGQGKASTMAAISNIDRRRPIGWPLVSRRAIVMSGGASLAAMTYGVPRGLGVMAQEGTPASPDAEAFPPFSAEEQLALETIVERQLAAQAIPGAVVGVWVRDRGAWTHAAGIADLDTATPISSDDHFRIASVTKTFVATVVLQLVDEGALRLDDRLESFVTGIPNGEQITVHQLLGMTAGIFNYVTDPLFEEAYSADPLMPFTPDDAIAIIERHPPDVPPGERMQYSDSNYILLGLIIEQVTGQSAGDAIASRIIEPLRLTGASFPTTPEMPEPYARGYAADPGSAVLRDLTASNPNVAWTAGAMISTLDDLRVWAKALAEGTLLDPRTQQERLEVGGKKQGPGFSLGYGLGIMEVNGFYGHNGSIYGYSTWMLHSPDLDATIVVLANRGETQAEFAGTMAIDIAHLLFPEQFPRAAGTPAPVMSTPVP